jgi:hypothetical protein
VPAQHGRDSEGEVLPRADDSERKKAQLYESDGALVTFNGDKVADGLSESITL